MQKCKQIKIFRIFFLLNYKLMLIKSVLTSVKYLVQGKRHINFATS